MADTEVRCKDIYSRCHTLGLLEEDRSLKIEVRVEVLDELITGGHIERRRLLQENNNSLAELKTLLVENIKERERERGECPVCQNTVECPVCSEEVRRPMRLTQCSQVKLSLMIPTPPTTSTTTTSTPPTPPPPPPPTTTTTTPLPPPCLGSHHL